MTKFYVVTCLDKTAFMSNRKENFQKYFNDSRIIEVSYPSSKMNRPAAMAYWRARYCRATGRSYVAKV